MPPEIYPIIAALFTANSILVVLVNGWFSRRQRRADADKTREEAEALDVATHGTKLRTLKATCEWWEEKYGGVVQRSDGLKAELDAVGAHFDEFKASANTAISNLRERLDEEEKQRKAQAVLLAELKARREKQAAAIIELRGRIRDMQAVIDQQAATIMQLHEDLVRSNVALNEERRMRTLLEEHVAEFDHRSTENVS